MATPPAQPSPQQEAKPVAEPEANDPWTGPLGPKIKPEPIAKNWRNDRDPTRRRATFGVPYPLWEVAIEKKDDLHTKLPARFEGTKRRSVSGVRLYLLAPHLIFSDADFDECKFHRPGKDGESRVLRSTFKSCTFKHCFLGGTLFRYVTFEDCTFLRCDLGDSEFRECQFVDCTFTDCTAENTSFVSTEVDPTALLRGMPPPLYNYKRPVPDGEATAAQISADWIEVRRKLAAQLLSSNTEIHDTGNSDRGLFELKRAEVKACLETVRTHPLRAPKAFSAWMLLHVTKGGTSLSRLFLTAIPIVILYAALLSNSHVTFMNQDCHLDSFELSSVLRQFARATSLFLAIGYTAFSGGTLATVLLTAAASLGLFWYALVAAVVIRRVYR